MKIYIAAKYARRLDIEMGELRHALEKMGHEITAQWLDNAEESKGLRAAAEMDVDDVLRADAVLFIGEQKGSANRGGGRWFELGLAYHAGKVIFAILPEPLDPSEVGEDGLPNRHESVFTALDGVLNFTDVDHFLGYMEHRDTAMGA